MKGLVVVQCKRNLRDTLDRSPGPQRARAHLEYSPDDLPVPSVAVLVLHDEG